MDMFKTLEKGQSTLEYLLLMFVVVVLCIALFKSDAFKQFMGKDSDRFKAIIARMEYSYRHGRDSLTEKDDLSTFINHPTFYNKEENKSRFFSPKSKYPQ